MAVGNSTPGAGLLKGSPFLLYSDFKTLSDRPDFDMYEQTNKARDILIRIAVILESKDSTAKKYKGEIAELWELLNELMEQHFDFTEIQGSNEWKNDYWKKITYLIYRLNKIQDAEKIIESEMTEDMRAPFSMRDKT